MSYFSELNNTKSAMRLGFFAVLFMAFMVFLSIAKIIWFHGHEETFEWIELACFVGAMSTFIGVAFTGKWLQKKDEIKNSKE